MGPMGKRSGLEIDSELPQDSYNADALESLGWHQGLPMNNLGNIFG